MYGESRDTTENLEDSVIERAALEWALDCLEPELRDVIDMYYFRELKLREMAETLHISLPLVKYRLRRAKGRLRELLGKERQSMNLDDQMEIYKKRTDIMPDEDRIRQTVQASMESFLQSESEKILSYHSFLCIQFGLIRKRWWALQMEVLALVWAALMPAQDNPYIYRSLGLAATLFVILVIPELWKNRVNDCIEIEGSTYYTLRQIYSARILLFGLADILLITLFCCMAAVSLQISLTELLIQFIFPMTVTACICFESLGAGIRSMNRRRWDCAFCGALSGGVYLWMRNFTEPYQSRCG